MVVAGPAATRSDQGAAGGPHGAAGRQGADRAGEAHERNRFRRPTARRRRRRTDVSARTRLLLTGPILPTLLQLAWPNVLVMLAQASTGLIETWWVSHLGADALAGMALVFPGYMMMGMLSAGAVGGGIASAVARALGAGRRDDADALVLHALVDQSGAGARDVGAVPGVRPRDLRRDGRPRRLARGGAAPIRTSCSPATRCSGS